MSEAGRQLASTRGRIVAVSFRALIAVVIIGAGVGMYVLLVATKLHPEKVERAFTPTVVRAMTTRLVPVGRVWNGYGTARAMDAADVPAQIEGRVIERPASVEDGRAIEFGGLIVRLDPFDFEQRALASREAVIGLEAELGGLEVEESRQLEQVGLARDETDVARRDYERLKEAAEQGAVSPGELDAKLSAVRRAERVLIALQQRLDLVPSRRAQIRSRLASERAGLRIAEENLARATITSPLAGTIQSVGPEVGEWVRVGDTVARIVDIRRLEIPLRVPVSAGLSIAVDDRAELRPDGPMASAWSGTVTRIAPEADASSRTMTVFVEVTQDPGSVDRLLLPGQYVVGRVHSGSAEPSIIVPRRAVVADRVMIAEPLSSDDPALNGTSSLMRVRPIEVRVRYHLEGRFPELDADETQWAVLEPGADLPEGARVVLTNLDQIRAGTLVDVRDAAAGAIGLGGGS